MSDIFDSEAFCPLAWNGIYIQPDGSVDNCCVSKNKLGNLNQQSIEEIIHDKRSKSVRQQMLDGNIVSGCSYCYPDKKTKPTHRENLIDFYRDRGTDLYGSVDNFNLRYIDIRLRNTCNYGCIYCSPELSSTIAQEQKKFPIFENNAIEQAIEYFKKNAASLDKIYLAGGEPLMIKENEILLEEILKTNPRCNILVNSNLSLIRNNRIFDILTSLPNVSWLVSAEDMGDRYEYIRYKGSWKTFSENLLFLKSLVPKEKIFFNMVYLALNSKGIFNFIQWLKQHEFETENINIAWIHGHFSYDPRNLSHAYQKEIFEIMESLDVGPTLRNSIENIKVKFSGEFPNRNPNNITNALRLNDQSRNLDSRSVFPDIYQDVLTNLKQ